MYYHMVSSINPIWKQTSLPVHQLNVSKPTAAAAMHRLYLLGVEADFICSCQRRFDPLVSNQARQNVPQHVDSGLWTQTHFPGHPAVGDQHLQSEAHDVRQIPRQTKNK